MKTGTITNTRSRRSGGGGFALVLVLIVVAMLTVLLVSFTVAMRNERGVAANTSNAVKARLIADAAIAHAESLLAASIPGAIHPDRKEGQPDRPTTWWANPGRISVLRAGDSAPLTVPLYTHNGTPNADPGTDPDVAVNINRKTFAGNYPVHEPIGGNPVRMNVAWHYVTKNPTQPHDASANPYVGRYAFWMDAETTKKDLRQGVRLLNPSNPTGQRELAAASGAGSPYIYQSQQGTDLLGIPNLRVGRQIAPSNPAMNLLDLLSLPASFPWSEWAGIRDTIQEPGELFRLYPQGDADFHTRLQSQVTVWSKAPALNAFGAPRFVPAKRLFDLAGRGDLTGGEGLFALSQVPWDLRYPYHLPTSASYDTGGTGNQEQSMAAARYLSRIFSLQPTFTGGAGGFSWPGYPGNHANKWSGGSPSAYQEAVQTAFNILSLNAGGNSFDMPSDSTAMPPKSGGTLWNNIPTGREIERGFLPDPQQFFDNNKSAAGLARPYKAQMFTPHINEVAVAGQAVQSGGSWELRLYPVVEVWLPYGYERTLYADTETAKLTMYVTHFSCDVNGLPYTASLNPGNPVLNQVGAGSLTLSMNGTLDNRTSTSGQFAVFRPIEYSTGNFTWGRFPNSFPAGTTVNITNIKIRVAFYYGTRDPIATKAVDAARLLEVVPTAESDRLQPPAFNLVMENNGFGWSSVQLTTDPRLNRFAANWAVTAAPSMTTTPDPVNPRTFSGQANAGQTGTVDQLSKLASPLQYDPQLTVSSIGSREFTTSISRWDNTYLFSNAHQLTAVHTGMFSSRPWQTFDLTTPDASGATPDFLLLDLFAPMVSLAGNQLDFAVNVNSRIYPAYFGIPSDYRSLALRSYFYGYRLQGNILDSDAIAAAIQAGEPAAGYRYVGEIIPAVESAIGLPGGTTPFLRETLFRMLSGRLTTQSADFSVYGVAQSIKVLPNGRITVNGEQRFHAVLERAIWPGADGIYGNAKLQADGSLANSAGAVGNRDNVIDGPDQVSGVWQLKLGSTLPPQGGVTPTAGFESRSAGVRTAYNPLYPYFYVRPRLVKPLNP